MYAGQCDKLRRNNPTNEVKWQAMMSRAVRVPFDTFIDRVEMQPLLDDGETAESYIAAASLNDAGTGAYRSWWGDRRCWFLQTAGFEFIFVE